MTAEFEHEENGNVQVGAALSKSIPPWQDRFVPRGNPSPKLAITVDPEIHGKILAAASRDGISVSAWMTGAARRLAAVAQWEKQHGRLTAEEMADAQLRVQAQLRAASKIRRTA